VFPEDFLAKYKGLIFQIRSEGITVSDRRVVKLLKLFAASAVFDGRDHVTDGDFFVLRHIWNNLDQAELLEEIVNPVVDAYYRDRPEQRRFIGPQASLEDLLNELNLIRELFTSGGELSDIQLFSQLKNLNEIKAALSAINNETAHRMIREVDQLLESVFASSKFGVLETGVKHQVPNTWRGGWAKPAARPNVRARGPERAPPNNGWSTERCKPVGALGRTA
jgi:MoxR-like ATPase